MTKDFFLPLVFAEDYFIHKEGFIFYRKPAIKILPFIKNNKILVEINSNNYDLFLLMIEYFIEDKSFDYIYNTDKNHPLKIPLRHIKKQGKTNILKKDNLYTRVKSANSRCLEKITIEDIRFIIKRDENKCNYCNVDLHNKKWHLDHINPISRGGKNVIENLTLSCKTCNLMKNSMSKKDFINKCTRIYNFFNTQSK